MSAERWSEDLLARIEELVAMSCVLPDAPDCWEVRLYIDLELVLLFRLASDALGSGDPGLEVPPRDSGTSSASNGT